MQKYSEMLLQKMKTKKGFALLENTMNIIIAVCCIGLLIFLGVMLYGIFEKNQKIKIAKAHLEEISGLTDGIEEGGIREYLFTSLEDWVLSTNIDALGKTGECQNKQGCLCLCYDIYCNNLKICRNFDFRIIVDYTQIEGYNYVENTIRIKNSKQITLTKENGEVKLRK